MIFDSIESMSTRMLVFLISKAFIFGFALGNIGMMSFLIFALKKEEGFIGLSTETIATLLLISQLLLALFINMLHRRILGELSRRLGV